MNVLEIKGVSKSFLGSRVLDGTSMSVGKGEVFGLIGLNGAGKTTLIKIMLNLLDADSGKCTICGVDSKDSSSRENVFYLPEKFQPSQNLKVIEFFSIFVDAGQVSLAKLEEYCENLSLNKNVLNKKISSLSKGMIQKIGLIASIVEGKKLIILDEPMSGLDPKARIYLKNMLLNHKFTGNSVFFSSHILSDIDEICDRIAVLDKSMIKFVGTPSEFKRNKGEISLEKAFLKEVGND